MTMSRLRTGVAQIACAPGDLEAGFETHRRMIADARSAGIDVLVFPETSLPGYVFGEQVPRLAMAADDERLAALAALAPDMLVAVGFIEEGRAGQFYNAAALLQGGAVQRVHRKLNLPNYGKLDEGKRYAAGERVETCSLRGPWQAGLLVCADLWNPALVHLAMLRGTTCLLAPAASAVEAVGDGFSNPEGWALVLRFYAMIYGTPIVFANWVGDDHGAHYWGGSRILDADGRVLAQAGEREELIHAELDYAGVRRARFRLPTLRDADTALIHRELTRWLQDQPLA